MTTPALINSVWLAKANLRKHANSPATGIELTGGVTFHDGKATLPDMVRNIALLVEENAAGYEFVDGLEILILVNPAKK